MSLIDDTQKIYNIVLIWLIIELRLKYQKYCILINLIISKIVNNFFFFKFQYKDSDLRQHWLPDSVSRQCYECSEKFTTFRRRHHCRLCGQIFCSRCCNRTIPGKIIGYDGGMFNNLI